MNGSVVVSPGQDYVKSTKDKGDLQVNNLLFARNRFSRHIW